METLRWFPRARCGASSHAVDRDEYDGVDDQAVCAFEEDPERESDKRLMDDDDGNGRK